MEVKLRPWWGRLSSLRFIAEAPAAAAAGASLTHPTLTERSAPKDMAHRVSWGAFRHPEVAQMFVGGIFLAVDQALLSGQRVLSRW